LVSEGRKVRLDSSIEKAIAGKAPEDGFDGRSIQPLYANLLARDIGGTIGASATEESVTFTAKFTRTAADGLALIAKMDDPRAAGDSAVVIDMMTTLQRGAKRLRARNIYSSAQNVLSALHHEDDVTLSGRIDTILTREDKWDAARATLNELLPKAEPSDADMLSRLMRAPVTLETVQPDSVSIETDVLGQSDVLTLVSDITAADIVPLAGRHAENAK